MINKSFLLNGLEPYYELYAEKSVDEIRGSQIWLERLGLNRDEKHKFLKKQYWVLIARNTDKSFPNLKSFPMGKIKIVEVTKKIIEEKDVPKNKNYYSNRPWLKADQESSKKHKVGDVA